MADLSNPSENTTFLNNFLNFPESVWHICWFFSSTTVPHQHCNFWSTSPKGNKPNHNSLTFHPVLETPLFWGSSLTKGFCYTYVYRWCMKQQQLHCHTSGLCFFVIDPWHWQLFFLKEVSPLLLFTHLKLTAELHIKICLWSRVVSPPLECEGDGLPSGYGSRDSILRASTERDWKRRKRGQLGRLNRWAPLLWSHLF